MSKIGFFDLLHTIHDTLPHSSAKALTNWSVHFGIVNIMIKACKEFLWVN